MRLKYIQYVLFFGLLAACKEKDYALPEAKDELQNNCIKRTLGPNVAGLNIEFAYAIALPAAKGKIVSAQVEATIAGEGTTYLEHRSFYTGGNGEDVGIPIGDPSVNEGAVTKVNFTKDTNAVTLRYFYVIPKSAQGSEVRFTFSAKSSTGETVSYAMGPYVISRMDMKLDMPVKDAEGCFISIADMAVYTEKDAPANAAKIDLIYLHRAISGISFGHALVSPGADTAYLPGITLPPGVTNISKVRKTWNLRDFHLARLQYGVYIDDLDFQQLDMKGAPDYAINLKSEAGVWVETADGKYRAYVYVNKVDDAKKSATISIKRYTIK